MPTVGGEGGSQVVFAETVKQIAFKLFTDVVKQTGLPTTEEMPPRSCPASTQTNAQLSHPSSATPDYYVSILALLTSLVNQVLTSCVSSQGQSSLRG